MLAFEVLASKKTPAPGQGLNRRMGEGLGGWGHTTRRARKNVGANRREGDRAIRDHEAQAQIRVSPGLHDLAAELPLRRGRGRDRAIRATGGQQAKHFVRSGKLAVVETRSFVVGGSGFLWSRIEPDVDESAVDADPCGPFRALPINAFEARTVAPDGVLSKKKSARQPIRAPSDLSGRVLAVDIKSREPMRVMRYPVD